MQSVKKMKQVSASDKKQKVPNGEYTSTVNRVVWNEEFANNDVLDIYYTLTDEEGKEYPFWERFHNKRSNDRTQEFREYLEGNGITEVEDFEGCTEEVTIKKRVAKYGYLPSIDSRVLISKPASASATTVTDGMEA